MAKTPPAPRCADCRFFRPAGLVLHGETAGSCHRNPPMPVVRPESGYGHYPVGMWPLVQARDSCGEFKLKTIDATEDPA